MGLLPGDFKALKLKFCGVRLSWDTVHYEMPSNELPARPCSAVCG